MNTSEDCEVLTRFGFDEQIDNFREISLCEYNIIDRGTPRIFSKEEIMQIMGFKGLIGEMKFWRLLRRKFEANYWQTFYLKKTGDNQYVWMWYDCLAGWEF